MTNVCTPDVVFILLPYFPWQQDISSLPFQKKKYPQEIKNQTNLKRARPLYQHNINGLCITEHYIGQVFKLNMKT